MNPSKSADETELEDTVEAVFSQNRKVYGSRKIKVKLERQGVIISRWKISRIMKKKNLFSAYSICKFKVHKGSVNEAEIPNLLNRQFNEHPEYAAVVSDLTYVRVNYKWNYICLLVDCLGQSLLFCPKLRTLITKGSIPKKQL